MSIEAKDVFRDTALTLQLVSAELYLLDRGLRLVEPTDGEYKGFYGELAAELATLARGHTMFYQSALLRERAQDESEVERYARADPPPHRRPGYKPPRYRT